MGYVFNSLCPSFGPFLLLFPASLSASDAQVSLLFLKWNRQVSPQSFCFCWSLCQERCFPMHCLLPILLKFTQMSPCYVKTETYHSHHISLSTSPFCLSLQQRLMTNNIFFLFLLFTLYITHNNILDC